MVALTWVPDHFGNSKANSLSQQFDSSSTANTLETTIFSDIEANVTATHTDLNFSLFVLLEPGPSLVLPRVSRAMAISLIGLLQPLREYVATL